MRKSELKKMIREELINVLREDNGQHQLIIKITDSSDVWVEIEDSKSGKLTEKPYPDIEEAITSVIKYLLSLKKGVNPKL
jgi:hypothetical protein